MYSANSRDNRHESGPVLGMVFTEFLEMVEQRFSPAVADHLLTTTRPANGGAYTAVGDYPHQEIITLVLALSQHTGIAMPALVQTFGEYLFNRVVSLYPGMFADQRDSFSLLSSVDAHIHLEVHKLYPEAELPTISVHALNADHLMMEYRSAHAMPDLAEGLIRACIRHYHESLLLTRTDLPPVNGIAHSRFELRRT